MRAAEKYVMAVFSVIILFSVGLNVYDRLVVFPSIQTSLNNKDVRAFESWLTMLWLTNIFLNNSKTNLDVYNAWGVAGMMDKVAEIFTPSLEASGGLAHNLSVGVTYGTWWLYETINAVYVGNKTGSLYERELQQLELNMIASLRTTIQNIVDTTWWLSLAQNEGSLTQQLQENNVIAPLVADCQGMIAVGQQIYDYYHG